MTLARGKRLRKGFKAERCKRRSPGIMSTKHY